MKYFGFTLLLLCLSSCNYFEKKKVNAEDLLDEELKTFNWKEVDEYPSFTNCDSVSTKIERKQCFEVTLTNFITANLSKTPIIVTQSINDTVVMEFQISEKGDLIITNVQHNDLIKNQIPDIDSLLTQSIKGLPEIFPAIKRGQQVRSEFQLPIIIQAN